MTMKKKLLPLLIANVLCLPAVVSADVEIVTDRAVVGENDTLEARLRFPVADQGDLYVAARIGGKLRFYGEDGKFHSDPVPYKQDGTFDQEETIFRFPGMMVPAGRYILYAAITDAGADVYDTSRWHGPLARQLFIANEPDQMSGDHDGDGWPDDDSNHDGFSDMDHNYDGWRDDDENHNGIPDQDENGDGQSGTDSQDGSGGQDDGGNSHDDNGSSNDDNGNNDDNGSSNDDSGNSNDDSGSSNDDNGSSNDDNGSSNDDNGSSNDDNGSSNDDSGSSSNDDSGSSNDDNGNSHDDSGSNDDNGSTGSAGDPAQGEALYAQNCSGCHGSDPAGNRNGIREGRNAGEIHEAIAKNKGGMGYLADQLSAGDIDAIAAYIRARTGG